MKSKIKFFLIFSLILSLIFPFFVYAQNVQPACDINQVNVEGVSNKYALQSAMVRQVGGGELGAYQADVPPNTPASVLKLIIAHAFLNTNPDLNKTITVAGGQTITLREALTQTLMKSSDAGANALTKEAGGPAATTTMAHSLGYTSSKVGAYYDSSATIVQNSSTSKDLSNAMNNVYTAPGENYKVAQDALRNSTEKFGLPSEANKWGGVPGNTTGKPVTGNSAIFEVGGKKYIVTMFINEKYESPSSPSVQKIRDATNEIVGLLKSALPPGCDVSSGARSGVVKSNCVITKVGAPAGEPVLPPECQTSSGGGPIAGLETPSNLECKPDGYCKMPNPTDGSYAFEAPSCSGQHWGSKELISVLYTVAKNWKAKYPQGRLNIGDLTASGHKSHFWGRAVDLDATTNGSDAVADYTRGGYNREATIELGKMFANTNQVLNIWYNDQAVNNAVLAYSKEGHSQGMVMMYQDFHDNHFHLDVKQTPEKLPYWSPGC